MDMKCCVKGIPVALSGDDFTEPDYGLVGEAEKSLVREVYGKAAHALHRTAARALYRTFAGMKTGNESNGVALTNVLIASDGEKFRYDNGKWLDESGIPVPNGNGIAGMLREYVTRLAVKYRVLGVCRTLAD